jgi:hypothetical protein
MVSFALRVLSNTRSIVDFILPFGMDQNPKYLTVSDSGVMVKGSSLYVTLTFQNAVHQVYPDIINQLH